jgi:hypothetical protein
VRSSVTCAFHQALHLKWGDTYRRWKTREMYTEKQLENMKWRDETTGGWRELHNERLHSLCSSPSIIIMIKSRRMRWAGHVARIWEKRNAYRILVGKPEGKRPLGRSRHRCVENIKMDLRESGWDGMDWIDLAHNRDQWRTLVNTVMNLRVP